MELLCHDFIDLITDLFFIVLNLFIHIFFFIFGIFSFQIYMVQANTVYPARVKTKNNHVPLGGLANYSEKGIRFKKCNNLNKSKMLQRIFPYVIYIQCAIMAK